MLFENQNAWIKIPLFIIVSERRIDDNLFIILRVEHEE